MIWTSPSHIAYKQFGLGLGLGLQGMPISQGFGNRDAQNPGMPISRHCDSELDQIWQEKEFGLDLLFSTTQLKLLFFPLLSLRFVSAENCSRSEWRKPCGHLAFTCDITQTHKRLKILFIVHSIERQTRNCREFTDVDLLPLSI